MSKEEISHAQMRDILQAEHGVIFFPKRDLLIPTIDLQRLTQIVAEGKYEKSLYRTNLIYQFLDGEAAGDSWGSDHESRRAWRRKLTEQYGEAFIEVYHAHNQFRVNKISLTRISIDDLGTFVADPQISQGLGSISEELLISMRSYDRIESLDDKLAIVHLHEDKSIEALGMLS